MTSVLEESFRGFSSVSCNALSVNAADGKIVYVPTELSSALSAIDVKSGTLLLDKNNLYPVQISSHIDNKFNLKANILNFGDNS